MSDDPHDFCPAFLLPQDIAIFMEMSDGEMVYPARVIAEVLDLAEKEVMAAQCRFRALGLTRTGPLFSEDDGKLCGRGTWLNKLGLRLQDMLRPAELRRYS